MRKLLIVDGKNLLWKNCDVFSDLVCVVDGEEVVVGGICGFLSSLLRIHKKYGGEVIICWDGKNNFRYQIYCEYKNNRKAIDEDKKMLIEEVKNQELRLKAIIRALGIRQYRSVGCEADDVMATLAFDNDGDSLIYTSDSDLRQAVDPSTIVVSSFRGKDVVYDLDAVFSRYGVVSDNMADLKALSGDSSDNIPGAPGVGQKTAVKLIRAFGSVDNIIDNVDSVDWPVADRFRKIIKENSSKIILFKKLTKLKIPAGMKAIKPQKNSKLVYEYFKRYKFVSFVGFEEMNAFGKMGKNVEEKKQKKEHQGQ
jgi:DNA polymerase-1